MPKLELHWQILIAIILAAIVGGIVFNSFEATGVEPTLFGVRYLAIFDYIGTIFLNALKMIIVPLITSSIIVGVAGIGSSGDLGRLGGKTLVYYMASSLLAILVGLALVNLTQPGIVNGEPARDLLALDADTGAVAEKVGGAGAGAGAGSTAGNSRVPWPAAGMRPPPILATLTACRRPNWTRIGPVCCSNATGCCFVSGCRVSCPHCSGSACSEPCG